MSAVLSSNLPASVNKRELAAILGCSLPTVSAWIDRYPDFPVIDRGTNGKEWHFDPEAVTAYVAELKAAEARQAAEQQARIQQLGLPFTDPGDGVQPSTANYSLDDIKRIQALDKLRMERGFLVDVSETRQAFTAAIARWSRAQRAVINQAGRDFNLPDGVTRALFDRMAEAQRQFVRDLRQDADLLSEPPADATGTI